MHLNVVEIFFRFEQRFLVFRKLFPDNLNNSRFLTVFKQNHIFRFCSISNPSQKKQNDKVISVLF